jgi:hypothetical protein
MRVRALAASFVLRKQKKNIICPFPTASMQQLLAMNLWV